MPTVKHLVDSLKSIEQKRGILGVVVAGGGIAIGDRVKLELSFLKTVLR